MHSVRKEDLVCSNDVVWHTFCVLLHNGHSDSFLLCFCVIKEKGPM